MSANHLYGATGIAVAFLLALTGTAAGLALGGAARSRWWRLPVLVAGVTLGVAVTWALLLGVMPGLGAFLGPRGASMAGAVLTLAVAYLAGRYPPRKLLGPRVERGTRLIEARDARPGRLSPGRTSCAGQAVPALDESKHFKVIGTTGTGKSTAIRELIGGALARGDRLVIADPDGAYLQAFYDAGRGDRVLNPFEPRAMRWDLFGELRESYDGDLLARALVPDQGGDDRAWRGYARVLLSALLRQLQRAGCRDVSMLHRLVTSAPIAELRLLLAGTAAAPFLDEDNARFFASVRAIATTQLAVLEHLDRPDGAPLLSVRSWVRAEPSATGGVLFLPYRASQVATLRGVVSTWLRLAIFETMELGEADHRIWFVIDELDALGAIDGLKDALARLRKYGGRCVIGFQSIAQVTGTYGSSDAQTIVENCGNTLILRCSAAENGGTARFASKLIGEREIIRRQLSRSKGAAFERAQASRTISLQHTTESAVLAAEIEQLRDLEGYLKFASTPEWRRVRLSR
jgi:type IV secretory pathway TraG/TraD family ATPase VirD4